MGAYFDQIKIDLNKDQFYKQFKGLDGNPLSIPENIKSVNVPIPTQHPVAEILVKQYEQQAEAFETASDGVTVATVLSYFMNFALGQVWSAINILQITTHLGFIEGKLPACVNSLMK